MTDWVTEDDDAMAALANLVVVLADNKYAVGRRMSEWAVGPPTLEGSVAGAAIGQQLLGQARLLYPVLEQLPGVEIRPPDETQRRAYNMAAADGPWEDWSRVVAGLLLVNTASTVVLEGLSESGYEDLATRVTRMLQDGRFQQQYAAGRTQELVDRYEPGRQLLQEQVDQIFPEVLAWFGPEDEAGVQAMARVKLIEGDGDRWRTEWLDRVSGVLDGAGITYPAERDADGKWDWEEVAWERWNSLQRRLETQPATATR